MSDGYLVSDNNDSEQHNAWKISAWHAQPIVSRKLDKFRLEFLTTGLARDLIDMNTCIKASDMPVKAFDNVFFFLLKKTSLSAYIFISYNPDRICIQEI